MPLDYFTDLEDFYLPELDPKKATKARKEILDALETFNLEVPAAKLTEKELLAQPGHVLFAWMFDHDLSLSFYAIPDSKLSPSLAEALSTASNATYTHFEMALGDEKAKAFVRLDAAMGVPGYDKCIKGFADEIADADKKCLAKYRVAYFEDEEEPKIKRGAFDKRFVAAHAVRRSQ